MKPAVRQLLLGAWTPRNLFGNAQGAWFDPNDLSSMFQDAAGTTPCAVGSPVGLRLDKSGRGNHATQGTSASRPILRQDVSGRYYSESDGFDDSFTSATGGGATAGFFHCAAIKVLGGAGTTRRLWSDQSGQAGYIVSIDSTNKLQLAAGNGVAFSLVQSAATFNVGETHVVTAWDDGANLNVQIDGGAVASGARPVVSAGTAGFTLYKDNGLASGFANVGDYGIVYRAGTVITATERERVKRFLASRSGVTL